MIERLLTLQQLAEKLQVRNSWIYARTRETGEDSIPRIKLGKYLRFPEQKVEEWLNKQNQQG